MSAEKGFSGRQKAFFIIFILFSSFFFSIPSINAQSPHAKHKISKALSEKISSLQSEEKVKVIIKLKKPTGKFQIQSTRNSVKTDILGGGGKVRMVYSIFDGMAAEIPVSRLDALADNPNIELIMEDKPVKAFLTESAPLINADDVWTNIKSGVNITGKGQTACVIDTGVDYNHPDLGGGKGAGYKVLGGYNYEANPDNSDPMDDNGHGTHVAGIIAANGTLKGVAPDANIIAIKALDSSGTGSSSDVIAGIDWCVTNAATYNITVISMSLGGSRYNSYCDNEDDETSMRDSINAAVGNNITVVVATGNDANYTSISSPACIQNATRVGATYDGNGEGIIWSSCTDTSRVADNITCFTNRGANFSDMLLAPGALTNSTWLSNGYSNEGGTSMAAPHVSGLMTLLNQEYKSIYGINPTPDYIYDIINSTGKPIVDSQISKTFYRINASAAYNAIDITSPNITFVSPTPSNNTNQSQNYVFVNVSSNENLSIALLEWNSVNVTMNRSWNANKAGLTDGTYTYKVWGNDSAGSWGVSETRVVIIDTTKPIIITTSPQNVTYLTNSINLKVSANETIDSWSYSLNDGANITFTPNTTLTASGGSNNILVYANDSAGNLNSTIVYFSIDTTPPSITIISPQNDTISDNTPLMNVTFGEIVNYTWYNINSTTNSTSVKNTSNLTVQLGTFPNGQHNITVYANDTWGNLNSSSVYFTIDTTPPSITILSPENSSTSDNTPLLNVTFVEVVNYTWYNINSTTNSTTTSETSILTVELSELEDGQHNITVYANDTWSNTNSSIVWFTVDTRMPNVTNLSATPSSLSKGGLTNITVNVSELNLDKVLLNITYPNGTIITETMSPGGGYHLYEFNASEYGTYEARVIANDTANNVNNTVNISFYAINSYSNTTNVTNGSTVVVVNTSDLIIEVTANETKNATVTIEATLSPSTSSFALVGEINTTSAEVDQAVKYLNVTNATDLSNLSRIKIRMYYLGPEVSGLDNDTLSIYYWNGTNWIKCEDYIGSTIPNGPYIYDADRDTTNQYVWVEVNHFSVYGLAGNVYVAPTSPTVTSSGGGGGGGGSPSPITLLSAGANELTPETFYNVLITLSAGGKINKDRFVETSDTLAASFLLTKKYPLPIDSTAAQFARTVETITGDIYAQAAEASEDKRFQFGALENKLVVARGDLGVDSMAAVAYAKAKNIPILLVKPNELPSVTEEAISKFMEVRKREIIIVGGPIAVSTAVEEKLLEIGDVKRIYGETRIETAIALAEEAFPNKDKVRVIVLTDYANPRIDAALMSYVLDAPLLYVKSDGLSPIVKEYILNHKKTIFGNTKIVLMGIDPTVSAEINNLLI